MAGLFETPRADPPHRSCVKCRRWGSCGMNGVWYCVEHVPADFWPKVAAAPDDVGDVI